MMRKRINIRLMATVLVSLADEAIIITIAIVLLSRLGVDIPWWAVVSLALIFLAYNSIAYWALQKNPQMGFENMIGKTGFSEGPVTRKGTVRIGRELWSASTRGEKIEARTEIIVVAQTGLKLTVIKNPADADNTVTRPANFKPDLPAREKLVIILLLSLTPGDIISIYRAE